MGAEELLRWAGPSGTVGHAELRIGESTVWLADEAPEAGFHSPLTLGGAGACMFLYVDDVDAAFARALAAGAEPLRPVEDLFYGDRAGTLRDPFGHVWTLATRREEFSSEELRARAADFLRRGSR